MLNQILIIFVLLFTVLSFGLGIFSIVKNPRSFTVKLWFLMSLFIGIWSLNLFLLMTSNIEQEGIFYSKVLHVGASFIPIFFLHFVLSFLHQDKNQKIFLIVGYVLALVFAFLSLTKEIVASVAPVAEFPFWIMAGRLYPFLLIYFWLYVLIGIYFLCRGYGKSDGILKRKIIFVLVATLIGFGGGGTNFLPQTVGIYPFGDFFAWLYPILVTYGIFVDEFKLKLRF